MPSIFIGCGNLRVFRIMSSSIPTKTCEYPQIPALHKNRGYRSCGRSYKSKYPYAIKTEGIKNIGGVLFLNTRNTLISVWNWVLLSCLEFSLKQNRLLYELGVGKNRNKKYSIRELWNYFYSYLGMRNTRDAHKAKAIAHMNEQEDIHIKCDTPIFLLRSLLD